MKKQGFSNQSSAILGKLELSKILAILLLFILVGCKSNPPHVNTELICENKFRILVKFVRAEDLKEGIYQSYLKNKREKSKSTYTAVRLKDDRTLAFTQLRPEQAVKCLIQESYLGFADPAYVHHPFENEE